MSNRNLWAMTILLLAGIALLFVMNMTSVFDSFTFEKNRLELNDVQGISIEKDGKTHVLNLQQQVQLVKYLNLAVTVEKKTYGNENDQVDFERIVISRLKNQPELIITPVAYISDNLLFSAPSWNPNGYFRDTSEGKLKQIITQATQK